MDVDDTSINDGNNPAWSDFLSVIPEEHHAAVIPQLKSWDSGVQDKINGVHSQYADYKPFIENKVPANQVQMGYNILRALEENPEEVVKAIMQTYNLTPGQQGSANGGDDDPYEGLPQAVKDKLQLVDQLQQQQQAMGQSLQQQHQANLVKTETDKLNVTMNGLRDKHGAFDEEIVLNLMLQGYEAEAAVQRYNQLADSIRAEVPRPSPPKLLGSGGSAAIPGNKVIDPRKLNDRETTDLVAQMLEQAARSKNG